MFSRFHRLIGIAIFLLLCTAWLYRSDSHSMRLPLTSQSNSPPSDQSPTEKQQQQQQQPPAAADSQQPPQKYRYADLTDDPNPSSTTTASHIPAPTTDPVLSRKSPYAYVLYATTDEFACSALVIAQRLKEFHTPHRIFVLLTDNVAPEYNKSFEEVGAKAITVDVPVHPHPRLTQGMARKELALVKLHAFRLNELTEEAKDVRRVLFLDADQFVYHSLDSVFELPDVDLAAPRAYWKEAEVAKSGGQGGQMLLSSRLMLIEISTRVWQAVENAIKHLKLGEYDFELINNVFGPTALVLPGQYSTPDSHWVDWDMPKWFRPESAIHDASMLESYSKAEQSDLWNAINANVEAKITKAAPVATAVAEAQPNHKLRKRDEPVENKKEERDDLGEVLTPEQVRKEEENAKAEEGGLHLSNLKGPPHPAETKPAKDHSDVDEGKVEIKTSNPDEKSEMKVDEKNEGGKHDDTKEETKAEDEKEETKSDTSKSDSKPEEKKEDINFEDKSIAGLLDGKVDKSNPDEKKDEDKSDSKADEGKLADEKPDSSKPDSANESHNDSPPAPPASTTTTALPTTKASSAKKPTKSDRPPWPYKPEDHPNRDLLHQLYMRLQVLHYGALWHPWEKNLNMFKEEKPKVHPVMYEQMQIWRHYASLHCPKVKRLRKDPKEGEDKYEYWKPVFNV